MITTEILIFFIIFLVINYFWKHRRFFYLGSKIPHSDHDYSLKGFRTLSRADPKEIFQIVYNSFAEKTYTSKTWFGTILNVGIVNPEDVKFILNSKDCLDKPRPSKFAKLLKGSAFGELKYWHSHRKILNPYFGTTGLRSVIPIFNEKVKVLMKNVGKMEGKGEFNVLNYMMALTLETIIKIMESDVDIQNQKDEIRDSFKHNLEKFGEIFNARIFKFWLYPDFIYNRTTSYQKQKEAESKSGMKFAESIIENVRKSFFNEGSEADEPNKTFIRALIDPKNNFSEDEILDEVKTFLAVASDTSAIASSSTLLLLAMHKDIQQKVLDELHSAFGKVTEAPFLDINDLNKLDYLEMVINETMRLLPVIPFVLRENSAEIQTSDGYILPIGTQILIPIFILHRSKQVWGDDADKFRPGRFEKEHYAKIHPYSFIPFTKGPRICIGWRYAMYLMKIQLTNFLLRYEVDTSLKYEELEFQAHITLNISQGYNISIRERLPEKI